MMHQHEGALAEYFDSIQIINLAHRKDRRREVRRELRKLSIEIGEGNVSFFPAVKPNDADGFPSLGARGCFMSHLNLLKQAKDAGINNLLVMEDDLNFINRIEDKLPDVLRELDRLEWDIAYLGHNLELDINNDSLFKQYSKAIQTTHFYAIKGKIIPQLIGFLELVLSRRPGDPRGGPMHVDGAISTFREQNPSIRTIVLCKPIGYQRPSRTDIHQLAIYDRLPVLRSIASLYRKVNKNTYKNPKEDRIK